MCQQSKLPYCAAMVSVIRRYAAVLVQPLSSDSETLDSWLFSNGDSTLRTADDVIAMMSKQLNVRNFDIGIEKSLGVQLFPILRHLSY